MTRQQATQHLKELQQMRRFQQNRVKQIFLDAPTHADHIQAYEDGKYDWLFTLDHSHQTAVRMARAVVEKLDREIAEVEAYLLADQEVR